MVLQETAPDPARLEIELIETVAVEHDYDAIRTINQVRDLGVRVVIDDFGVGHSALGRLESFPVDRLNIDRTFVTPLTSAQSRSAPVRGESDASIEHRQRLVADSSRLAEGGWLLSTLILRVRPLLRVDLRRLFLRLRFLLFRPAAQESSARRQITP